MSTRSLVRLLLLTGIVASGCKDKDSGTSGTPSATPSASAPTATAAAAKPFQDPTEDPSPAPSSVLPTGTPVSAKTLARFDPPQPKNAPASALWTSVSAEKDGDRWTNLVEYDKKSNDKKTYFMSLRFIDCRAEKVKSYAGKPLKDTGDFAWCFVTLPEKHKGFPSYAREKGSGNNAIWDARRVVRAGNVIVTSGASNPQWKLADLDTALADMDWATISKW